MMKIKHCIHNLWRTALCLLAVLTAAACSDSLDTPDTPSTALPGAEPGSVVLSLAGLPATRNISAEIEEEVERLDVLIFRQPEEQDNALECVYHRRFRRSVGTGTAVAEDLFTTGDTDSYTYYAVLGRVADFVEGATYYVYVLGNTHADKPENAETVTQTDMQKALDTLFPLSDNTGGCSHDDPQGSLDDLKTFVYTTENIHLSGDKDNRPNVFLMDGMAYMLNDESDPTALQLNGGDLFAVRNLYATLRRAAAKVTVTLTADPSEDHTVLLPERLWVPTQADGSTAGSTAGQSRYGWQNVNQREDTYLVTPDNYGIAGNETKDFPAAARLASHNSLSNYTVEVEPGLEGTFKATTYSYSHYWDNTASSYEYASYLTVRVPVIYCADGIPDGFDYATAIWTPDAVAEGESASHYTTTIRVTPDGNITDETDDTATEKRIIHYYVTNYYKIPMGKDGRMDRNTHYYVTGNLTRPGSTTADKPMEIKNVRFQVVNWITEHIDAGGESDVHYLMVNKNDYTIRNVDSDNTLIYSSSHPVTVTMTRAWYTNKRGIAVDLLQYEEDENGDPTEYMKDANGKDILDADGNRIPSPKYEGGAPVMVESVEVAKLDGSTINRDITFQLSALPETATALNGAVDLQSPSPANNLIRHIELLITNTKGDYEIVTIHQYPLDYIQFKEGYYSYWTNSGSSQYGNFYWSNFEYYRAAQNESGTWGYFTNALWQEGNKRWVPRQGDQGPFRSRYVNRDDKGIYRYNWDRTDNNASGWKYHYDSGLTDYRMYHIQITSTSSDYVLARPKLNEDGSTASGPDNAKRVSPSFMINSQLGATASGISDTTAAKLYAAQYAEVYIGEDGETYVYDDWRLPTPAEIAITMEYQGTSENPSESMFMVMNGASYYTSNGIVANDKFPNADPNCLRLVRDIFSEEDLKGKKVSDIFGAAGSGYTEGHPTTAPTL